MKPKRTAGGSTVLSYEDVKPRRGLPAHVDPEWREVLQTHLDKHLGQEGKVFHEVVSETIRLDLSVHLPTPQRPFYTLATMGVSDAGLNVPEIAEDFRHIELLCYLPDGWNVDFRNAVDESWWPGRLIKQLGRFVHEYRTFFAPGHTIPNPDGPYSRGSVLETALLVPPFLDPEEFHVLEHGDKRCRFLAVWPITKAECQLKLERGTGDLLDMLEKAGVSPVIDPWRNCAVTRRKPSAQAKAEKPDARPVATPPAPEPDPVPAKMSAALALLTGKRFDECIAALQTIGADHPERWGECFVSMGEAYVFLGEFDKAIACYTQAMKHGAEQDAMTAKIGEARTAMATPKR